MSGKLHQKGAVEIFALASEVSECGPTQQKRCSRCVPDKDPGVGRLSWIGPGVSRSLLLIREKAQKSEPEKEGGK